MTFLEIQRVVGVTTVQDQGRAGAMHAGVPPGGALVPELLAAANAAVGNTPGAAALEIAGSLELVVRGAAAWLAVDDGMLCQLGPGARLTVEQRERSVRYLAVRGGIEVPRVLRARATLLVAALGGFQGRALRAGDHVPLVDDPGGEPAGTPRPVALDEDAPIHLIPGPDLARFAPGDLDALLATTWTVSPRCDRVGMRLDGGALHPLGDAQQGPMPMVRGAIQVPPSGEAIVLGPDHPVTGGYPVIAVVAHAGQGPLAARRPGRAVRFRIASPR